MDELLNFKTTDYSLVLYSGKLNNFLVNEGIVLEKNDIEYLNIFLSDFYSFNIDLKEDAEHFFTSSISNEIGFTKYIFLPKENCKNNMVKKYNELINYIRNKIITKIYELYEENYVICLYDGLPDMNLDISVNPVILEYEEFLELNQLVIKKLNFDFLTKLHTTIFNNTYYLNQELKSLFSKRIISFYPRNKIVYDDQKSFNDSLKLKNEWLYYLRR